MLLEHLVEVLADVAAALLGHGRNGHSDDLAVRLRIETEIGTAQRLSISFKTVGSQGEIKMSCASGVETCASWLSA